MEERVEGKAFQPLTLADPRVLRSRRGAVLVRDAGELPCQVCGAPVVVEGGRRICLNCGFMAGCFEGIF